MSTTYPAGLPPPQRDPFTVTVAPASTATARERSPDRVRPQGLTSLTTVDLVYRYTDAEFATFRDWWRGDLKGGSLQATLTLPNGLGNAAQAVQFLGEPSSQRDLMGGWEVSLKAWLPSPPRLTSGDIVGMVSPPYPQWAGNARSPQDLAARSAMNTGPILARQRFTWPRERCPVTWMLTFAQLARFDAWWHLTLNQGARWFQVPLRGEAGIATTTARMGAGYTARLADPKWQVAGTLELDAPPTA